MLEARALTAYLHTCWAFGPYGPRAAYAESGLNYCAKKSLPASTRDSGVASALRLLEGVVDGDGESKVGLCRETLHRHRHSIKEERLRLLLAAVPVGSSYKFLGLGYCQGGEEVWEDRTQRAA